MLNIYYLQNNIYKLKTNTVQESTIHTLSNNRKVQMKVTILQTVLLICVLRFVLLINVFNERTAFDIVSLQHITLTWISLDGRSYAPEYDQSTCQAMP